MNGKRFGRYTILGDLGSGGMGRVCRARDTVLGRDVALKLLHDGDGDEATDESKRVLLQEARAAAAIDHPNAVSIFDVGEIDGQPFFAMELISGKTLREHISEGVTPLAVRVAWLIDVANALAAAHRGLLLHRDIKPENVLVREDDGVVKVVDFGIARPLPAIDRSAATQSMRLDEVMSGGARSGPILTAGIRGTPSYMAPEQLRGDALDGRADQFAWEFWRASFLPAFTPGRSSDALATVRGIASEPAPSLRSRAPALGEGLERIVLRTLEKKREARFASMDDLVAALRGEAQAIDESTVEDGVFRVERALFVLLAACLIGWAVVSPSPPVTRAAPIVAPAVAPISTSADAVASYREGLQLVRDASRSAAVAAFEKAATIDSAFAAAHLRAAMFVDAPDSATRRHLQVAEQFRNGLSEYDRQLLRAFEAWEASPPDGRELAKRLTQLSANYPDASEVWLLLGRAFRANDDYRRSLGAYDRAAALAPNEAAPWEGKGIVYLLSEDLPRAREAFARCSEISPASESCVNGTTLFLEAEGNCRDEILVARKLISLSPKGTEGYRALANALYGVAKDLRGAREAVEAGLRQMLEPQRTIARHAALTRLAVLSGDFDEAFSEARRWEESEASAPDEGPHVSPAWYQITIARELGQNGEAIALANDYLRKRAGWMPNETGINPSIYVLDALHRAHGMDDRAFSRFRDRWLAEDVSREKKVGDAYPAVRWTVGYAQTATTRSQALEALEALAAVGSTTSSVNGGLDFEWALGDVYWLAGDKENALKHLIGASTACQAPEYPFQHLWAIERLAELFEANGNRREACDTYRSVVSSWRLSPVADFVGRALRAPASAMRLSRMESVPPVEADCHKDPSWTSRLP